MHGELSCSQDIPTILCNATKKLNLLLICKDASKNQAHIYLHDVGVHESDIVDLIAISDYKNGLLVLVFATRPALYKFGHSNISLLMLLANVYINEGIDLNFLDIVLRVDTKWITKTHGIYELDKDRYGFD